MTLDRLSLVVPPIGPWREQEPWYRWAEDLGYDVVYTYDHLTHPTSPDLWLGEAFSTLSAAAAATERVGLGTLVASAVFRSPVTLARIAMTVQDISDGRLVLGLGMGSPLCAVADGASSEMRAMSVRFADVLTGYLAVLDGATEWKGQATSFGGLETAPSPAGAPRPELLLAAHGPRAMRLTARFADTWNTYGGPGSSTLVADDYWPLLERQTQSFTEICEAEGRDPSSIRRSVLLGFGRVRPTASVDEFLAAAERVQRLGFDELVVYGPASPGGMGSDAAVHEQAIARLR